MVLMLFVARQVAGLLGEAGAETTAWVHVAGVCSGSGAILRWTVGTQAGFTAEAECYAEEGKEFGLPIAHGEERQLDMKQKKGGIGKQGAAGGATTARCSAGAFCRGSYLGVHSATTHAGACFSQLGLSLLFITLYNRLGGIVVAQALALLYSLWLAIGTGLGVYYHHRSVAHRRGATT